MEWLDLFIPFLFGFLIGAFAANAFGKWAIQDATERLKEARIILNLAYEKTEKDIEKLKG